MDDRNEKILHYNLAGKLRKEFENVGSLTMCFAFLRVWLRDWNWQIGLRIIQKTSRKVPGKYRRGQCERCLDYLTGTGWQSPLAMRRSSHNIESYKCLWHAVVTPCKLWSHAGYVMRRVLLPFVLVSGKSFWLQQMSHIGANLQFSQQ